LRVDKNLTGYVDLYVDLLSILLLVDYRAETLKDKDIMETVVDDSQNSGNVPIQKEIKGKKIMLVLCR